MKSGNVNMDRKSVLKFLKEKKTLKEIKKQYGDTEDVEKEIFKWVDDSYIHLDEDGDDIFFETVNNEFLKKKVREIGQLASYICTNPNCRRYTLAPSRFYPNKSIIVGEAAHIYGKKLNSPRFNKDLSSDEISNISNGIWLCRICHKIVDSNNGIDYPATTLINWKEEHAKWLRDSLYKPSELLRGQDWVSYLEWRAYISSHNKFLFKIDSYISKYSKMISEAIEKVNNEDRISIRILGPSNIGKKTILNDALEKCLKERKEQIFIYLKENQSILNKKFANNTIIVIQECSNKFHSRLLEQLRFDGIKNLTLISLGSDYDYKGTDKIKSIIIKIEGLSEYQTGELLQNLSPSISYSEIKKIHKWSGGIPGLILDIFNLFRNNQKKLENIEDYNYYWEENLHKFIKEYSYRRIKVINLLIKISLLFQIPYTWDFHIFKKSYLPYLSENDKELTQQIIKDLLKENLLLEKNGYLSIFPPLTSLYIIREKVEEEDLIKFLDDIIKSKNTSLIDSFIQQINYLDNKRLSNEVAYIIFNKIEYTSESLKDDFIIQALYRLSKIFPNEILRILSKIITELKDTDLIEINIQIFNILIDLAERSELFFSCFDVLLDILMYQWSMKNEMDIERLRQLFSKSDINFNTKIDYIAKIEISNRKKDYVLICLVTSLIYSYGLDPRTIIESKDNTKEEVEKFKNYKNQIKQDLLNLWELLSNFIDLEDKDFLIQSLEKINDCFLSLYCTGLWKDLLEIWSKILVKCPDLKINILKSIRFSPRLKNYSDDDDFDSMKSFYINIKEKFNIIEELRWFIHYELIYDRESYDNDFENKRIIFFATTLIKQPETQEKIITFLIKQRDYKVANLGAKVAEIDKDFILWSLIEKIFLDNIKESSTDFLNGYTYIIFEKDKTLWNEILSRFEKIDELKTKLYEIIIPKLPDERHLNLLMELYKQGLIPKERLRSIIHSFRKEKVSEYSEDDLVKAFTFYFSEIDNPLDGVELHYINEWLSLRDYSIPDQLKNQFIEILTSFEKLNQFQFYLDPKWDEIIDKIKQKDKNLYIDIRNRILEKLKENLSSSLFNRLEFFVTQVIKEGYDEVIGYIKNIIIENASSHSYLHHILHNFDINLIKIEDRIELCKIGEYSILSWVIDKHIDKLLQFKENPEFFNILLNEFQYKDDIIQQIYRSILRTKIYNDEKEFLTYLNESKEHLESYLNKNLPENIQFGLKSIINALESKLKKLT